MDPFTMIAISLLMAALLFVLTPKPKIDKLKPETAVEVPETEVGRPLPVIFGTVIERSPNVVWFGDLKIKRVRKKV